MTMKPLLHLDQIGSCFKIVVHSESQEISTISSLQVVGGYLIFLRLWKFSMMMLKDPASGCSSAYDRYNITNTHPCLLYVHCQFGERSHGDFQVGRRTRPSELGEYWPKSSPKVEIPRTPRTAASVNRFMEKTPTNPLSLISGYWTNHLHKVHSTLSAGIQSSSCSLSLPWYSVAVSEITLPTIMLSFGQALYFGSDCHTENAATSGNPKGHQSEGMFLRTPSSARDV